MASTISNIPLKYYTGNTWTTGSENIYLTIETTNGTSFKIYAYVYGYNSSQTILDHQASFKIGYKAEDMTSWSMFSLTENIGVFVAEELSLSKKYYLSYSLDNGVHFGQTNLSRDLVRSPSGSAMTNQLNDFSDLIAQYQADQSSSGGGQPHESTGTFKAKLASHSLGPCTDNCSVVLPENSYSGYYGLSNGTANNNLIQGLIAKKYNKSASVIYKITITNEQNTPSAIQQALFNIKQLNNISSISYKYAFSTASPSNITGDNMNWQDFTLTTTSGIKTSNQINLKENIATNFYVKVIFDQNDTNIAGTSIEFRLNAYSTYPSGTGTAEDYILVSTVQTEEPKWGSRTWENCTTNDNNGTQTGDFTVNMNSYFDETPKVKFNPLLANVFEGSTNVTSTGSSFALDSTKLNESVTKQFSLKTKDGADTGWRMTANVIYIGYSFTVVCNSNCHFVQAKRWNGSSYVVDSTESYVTWKPAGNNTVVTFKKGETIQIVVAANAGYQITGGTTKDGISDSNNGQSWTVTTSPIPYTVTFNNNGGTGGYGTSVNAYYGQTMPALSNYSQPTKDGYTFGGWYDTPNSSGGKQYYTAAGTSNVTFDKYDVLNLYARWNAIQLTVNFDANTGNGSMSPQTLTYGVVGQYFKANEFSKANCSFKGWSEDKNSTTAQYQNQNSVSDSWIINKYNSTTGNSVTLYAIWEQEQIPTDTYTVELENVSYIKNNSSYEKIPYETSYADASGYMKIECRIPAYVKIIVKKNGTKITPDFISDTYGSPSIKKVQPIRNDIYRIYMGQNADLQISNNANYSITIKAIANDFDKQMFAGMTLDSNSYASTDTLGFYYPSTDNTYAYQYSADYPKYIKTCDYTPAPQYGQQMENANGHYMFIYAAANYDKIKRWFNVGDKYYVLLMGSNDTYYGGSKGSLVKNVYENGTRLSQVGSICYGNHGEAYKSMNLCPKGLALWDASKLEYFVPMSDWGWFFKDGSNYVNDNGDIYSGTDYSFERWVSYSYGSWSKAFIFSPNAPLKSISWKEITIGADSTQNSYMLIKTNVEDLIENPITYNGGIKKGNDNLLLDTNGKKWNNHTITSLKEDSNNVGIIQPIWWDWNGSTWNQVTYYNKLQWVALLYDSVEVQRKVDNQTYAPNITIGFIIYHHTLFSPNLNWINATQSGSNIRNESYVVFKGVCQNDGTIIAQTTDLVQSPSAFYAKYECGELSASGHTFHDVIINNYSAEELSAIIYVLYADNNWQIINTLPEISNENRISSYGDRVFGKQLKLLFKNTTSTNTITTLTNTNSHLVDDGNTYGDAIRPGYDFEVHDEEMIKEGIFKVISEI